MSCNSLFCAHRGRGKQRRRRCTDATPIFFPEKGNGRRPSKRKAFPIASEQLEELQCLPIALLARGRAAFRATIRFVSTSIIRCRSAYLAQVQPNYPLPIMHTVSMMRTAASAAMPPRQATAKLIKSVVDGDCVSVAIRRQSDSEDRSKPSRLAPSLGRHPIPQAAQLFKRQTGNVGGEGYSPRPFSWG